MIQSGILRMIGIRVKLRAAAGCVTALLQLCALAYAQVGPGIAHSRPALPSNHHYVFESIGEQLGLDTKTVTTFLQDRQGFLWIGTKQGLLRFDGTNVTTYGRKDGLPASIISQLMLGPDGTVWVGTEAGIARFDGARFLSLKLPRPELQIQSVQQLFALDQNGIYIATTTGLLWMDYSNARQFHIWTHKDGLPQGPIDALYFGADGVLWFAVDNRLGRLRTPWSKPEILSARTGTREEVITAILVDSKKNLWVRTTSHISRFDLSIATFIPDDAGVPKANDFGIPSFDSQGDLMVPTVAGLFRHINNHWESVGEKQGMAADDVFAALEDREGAIWIGYGGMGFERWPGSRNWSGWSKAEGLPDNVVWKTMRDRQGRLWIGTNNGIAMWQDGATHWRVWKERDGLAGNTVRDLALGNDGSIWALSFPGGLTRFDPVSLAAHKVPVTPSGTRDPTTIAVGWDGRIWIGNPQYLKYLRPGESAFTNVPLPADIAGSTSSVEFSRDGSLWTAGRNGIARLDGKRWLHYNSNDGLRADWVTGLAPVSSSELWFHYAEPFGLGHLQISRDGIHIEHFTTEQGLSSNSIYMVRLDSKHQVWTGSDRGVSMMDTDRHVHSFSRGDGLLWDDVSDGGFWEESDGSMLFGTSRGLARFVPSIALDQVTKSPPAVITSVKLGGLEHFGEHKSGAANKAGYKATYNQRDFAVQFAALSFRDPKNIHCRYTLNGPESDSAVTSLRETRFPSLPSGSYQFMVSCRANSLPWGLPAVVSFAIEQPWWGRWWARLLEIILLVLLVRLIFRLSTRAMERDRRRLEVAVAARSAELAEANQELREASLTDHLTGMRNRRFFTSTIDGEVGQAIRAYSDATHSTDHRDLIFYLVDMDRFKDINDYYGHHAGDLALMQIAERLTQVVRQSDILIRWGGEEFLVVSRAAERCDAQVLAQRILSAISSKPFALGDGQSLTRTCSVGWAAFPWSKSEPAALSVEQVLKLVDKALYIAKNSGRNQAIGILTAEPGAGGGENSSAEITEMDGHRVQLLRLAGAPATQAASVN